MDRPDPPYIANEGDERTLLTQFLDFYRAALIDRAWGLDEAQLQQTLPPSSLSIGRLISHMAYVEHIWFRVRFAGQDMPGTFASLDWDADPDAEMTLSSTWGLDRLITEFDAAVAFARRTTVAASSLDQQSAGADGSGEHWNLRWILIHMIEEYARHCGHADLIREAIDGDLAR
jgi:uncharacterized damage-inducible protein DinB